MKLLVSAFLLVSISGSLYAQESKVIKCKNYADEFDYLTQKEQIKTAVKCKNEYLPQIKSALTEIKKNNKTACDYKELQQEILQYQEVINRRLPSKLPEQDTLDNMHEFYLEMYGFDQATKDCDERSTSQIYMDAFVLENTEIMTDIYDA